VCHDMGCAVSVSVPFLFGLKIDLINPTPSG
jgi:hypothetical protein